MALCTIGPRQMMASSSFSWKKDMESILTPYFVSGGMSRPSCMVGLSVTPRTRLALGQSMSVSIRPTTFPFWARVTARLTATVVFPTPPLPL